MGLFSRPRKAAADIRFHSQRNKTSKPSFWTSDDTIEGTAYFHIPPGTQCSRTSIALKGIVTTRTNESPRGSMQPNWRAERVRFLSVDKEFPAGPRSESDDGVVKIPFQFDLREHSQYSGLESGLPPSLDAKEGSKAAYDVTYTISASIYSSRGLIVSAAEKISILSIGQSAPPSYGSLEDGGEYFTAATDHSRSRIPLAKRASHGVEVAGQEPSPFVLLPQSGGGEPSTSVDLLLKVSSDSSRPPSDLPRQAHIRTQLVSNTRITPDAARNLHAGCQNIDSLDSQTHSKRSNTQDSTLAIPRWETYHPDKETPAFAIARLSFLYRLPRTERPEPTFSTPILSRSYALDVKVSFPDDGGQSLKISLPVHVLYEAGNGVRAGADDDVLERKN